MELLGYFTCTDILIHRKINFVSPLTLNKQLYKFGRHIKISFEFQIVDVIFVV
jgi:hypothetical protein